jgi:hypothetical protein
MAGERASGSAWGHVAGAVLGLTALLSLLLTAFAWPAVNTEPRDVPIAIAAPQQVAAQIEQGLSQAGEDAFEVTVVENRAAAVRLIEDRGVYGAIVATPQGGEVLTASAASPAVDQALRQVATGMGAADGTSVQVTDVVPLPADDPRGMGLAAGALPLVLGGIATAALLWLRVQGRTQRVVGVLGVAVVGGLALTAILQSWLGALDGSYWANASVVALAISATASAVLGLGRLLGVAGVGLGAATMLLLGNPLSGLTSAPEMLPSGWGELGQLLPPGAAGTALRSVAFFDGAGSAMPLLVLGCWLGGGLLLMLLPARLSVVREARQPAVA